MQAQKSWSQSGGYKNKLRCQAEMICETSFEFCVKECRSNGEKDEMKVTDLEN